MKKFYNLKTYSHDKLNISKGLLRTSELYLATPEEIKAVLGKQGVSDYKSLTMRCREEI